MNENEFYHKLAEANQAMIQAKNQFDQLKKENGRLEVEVSNWKNMYDECRVERNKLLNENLRLKGLKSVKPAFYQSRLHRGYFIKAEEWEWTIDKSIYGNVLNICLYPKNRSNNSITLYDNKMLIKNTICAEGNDLIWIDSSQIKEEFLEDHGYGVVYGLVLK